MKLLLMFFFSIAVSLFVIGFGSYLTANRSVKDLYINQGSQIIDKSEQAITYFLNEYESSTQYYAGSQSIMNHIKSGSTDHSMVLKDLEAFKNAHADLLYIYIGIEDKQMIMYPEDDLPEGYDPTSRDWYKQAKEKKATIWTDPYPDASTGLIVVTVATPVYDTDGKLLGVVGIDFTLTTLSEELAKTQIGENGYLFLTTSIGNVIAHPDETLLDKPIPVESVLKKITSEDTGSMTYTYKEKTGKKDNTKEEKKILVFNTVDKNGWKLGGSIYYSEVNDYALAILKNILILGVISLALGVFISVILANSISRPIKSLLEDMTKVKTGDFSIRTNVSRSDEIGDLAKSFNLMVEQLGILINNINSASKKVLVASENLNVSSKIAGEAIKEIALASDEIARSAGEEAEQAERGSLFITEISDQLTVLNANQDEITEYIGIVTQSKEKGVHTVGNLKNKNKTNQQSNTKIADSIFSLAEKIKEIIYFLETITTIAAQTNLLALNASIEAARAGEHGKGFAVVADEIRKLAEASNHAATEINTIVSNIVKNTDDTVSMMDSVTKIGNDQAEVVLEVDQSLSDISSSIEGITEKIATLNNSIVQLDHHRVEMVDVITNISAVSQETAAASEEVNATVQEQSYAITKISEAVEDLHALANELTKTINQFKI